jgi:zinc/manganese transport system substrate-binding protein
MNLRVLDSHAEGETAETEGHAHSHSKIGNSFDPHIWHSPRLTREAALNLYNFLAPRAPAMRNEWDTCLRTFVQRTKAVESAVHAKIATIPSTRRVLATNHDSMGYFASTFGLKIVAISGVSTEAQVTPGQLKRAIDAIKKTGAKAVFVESSASPETVQKVAAEAGVKVGGELFTDGLSAPGTPAGNITGLWETNAETLATSLRP